MSSAPELPLPTTNARSLLPRPVFGESHFPGRAIRGALPRKGEFRIALTSLLPVFFPEADSQLLHSCDSNTNKQTKKKGKGLAALPRRERGSRTWVESGAGQGALSLWALSLSHRVGLNPS